MLTPADLAARMPLVKSLTRREHSSETEAYLLMQRRSDQAAMAAMLGEIGNAADWIPETLPIIAEIDTLAAALKAASR